MKMKVFLDRSILHSVYREKAMKKPFEGEGKKRHLWRGALRMSGNSGSGKAGIWMGIGEQRRQEEESKAKKVTCESTHKYLESGLTAFIHLSKQS